MYVSYGDLTILREQYEPAKRWVDYMFEEAKKENPIYRNEPQYSTYTDGIRDADFIWDTGFHWGEWSEPNFVHRTLPENFMEDKAKWENQSWRQHIFLILPVFSQKWQSF